MLTGGRNHGDDLYWLTFITNVKLIIIFSLLSSISCVPSSSKKFHGSLRALPETSTVTASPTASVVSDKVSVFLSNQYTVVQLLTRVLSTGGGRGKLTVIIHGFRSTMHQCIYSQYRNLGKFWC